MEVTVNESTILTVAVSHGCATHGLRVVCWVPLYGPWPYL